MTVQETHSGENSASQNKVAVLFADEGINQLFSDLLTSRGVSTRIVKSETELTAEEKLITEPQYAKTMTSSTLTRCLVVGNKEVLKDLPALPLSRPLTEEKIEEALAKFLA